MEPPALLPGERAEGSLRPHPLGFLGTYLRGGLFAIWGLFLFWLFSTDWWQGAQNGKWYEFWTYLYGNGPAAYVFAVAGLAVVGAIIAVTSIRWRVFFAYVGTALAIVALNFFVLKWRPESALPVLFLLAAVPGLVAAEALRRSHRYHLTNLRIVFQGGLFVHRERQVRYESITDLDGSQGPLGRLLDYGTVIPVTQSGFGLGEDSSQAGMAVGAGGKKGGVGVGGGVFAGGGRSVQSGRARTFHQLTAVRPYRETKELLERLIQEATSTPYLREQVDLQRQMVAVLDRLETREGPAGAPERP